MQSRTTKDLDLSIVNGCQRKRKKETEKRAQARERLKSEPKQGEIRLDRAACKHFYKM
jgi:hypothetical protein